MSDHLLEKDSKSKKETKTKTVENLLPVLNHVACFKSLRVLMMVKLVFRFECHKVKQSSCFDAYTTKKYQFFEQKYGIYN